MTDPTEAPRGSEGDLSKGFKLKDFTIYPEQGEVGLPQGGREHIEDRHMAVLVELARAPHQVLSVDHFMERVWPDRIVETGNLHGAITKLRKVLGCDAKAPTFIKTRPTRGYELLVDVEPMDAPAEKSHLETVSEETSRASFILNPRVLAAGAVVAILAVALVLTTTFFPTRPTVAVLPFSAPEDERLPLGGVGVADYLIQALTRANDLDVVARRDSFAVPGANLTAETIAERLEADYLISGEVILYQSGVRLVLTVEDSASMAISTQVLEGETTNLARLYEETVVALSDTLVAELGVASLLGAEVTYTVADGARQKYLEARYQWHLRGSLRINRAIELLEEAIALRPDFPEAHLALAQALALRPFEARPPEPLEPSYTEARQALIRVEELTSNLGSEIAALRGSMAREEHDWQEATDQLQLALQLDPDNAVANYFYSFLLSQFGRYEQALEYAANAVRIDPYSGVLNNRLALAYLWVGENEKAAAHYRVGAELGYQDMKIGAFNAVRNQRWDTMRELLLLQGNDPEWVIPFVQGARDPEYRSDAVASIEQAIAAGRIPQPLHFSIWWLLRDTERAITSFDSREKTQDIEILWAPESEFLREHPQFPELVEAVGLTEFAPPGN
jgi:DNA-binding winged helix-turn-helix (wHTH) protein/tetratricopeptide (TPR) repeat protein